MHKKTLLRHYKTKGLVTVKNLIILKSAKASSAFIRGVITPWFGTTANDEIPFIDHCWPVTKFIFNKSKKTKLNMAKYNNQGFVGLDQPISSITQPPTVPFQDTVDKYFIY